MSQESDFQAAKVRFFMAKKARQEAAPDWAKWSKVTWLTLTGLFLAVIAWAGAPGIALSLIALCVLMPILPGAAAVAALLGLYAVGPKHKSLL